VEIIPLDKIKADKNASKEVVEVYEYLKLYRDSSARRRWLEKVRENREAIGDNKMWDDDEEAELKKAGMVPLVINKCNKGVQGSSAIVTDQKPECKFHPVGSGDLYDAELLKRAHDLIWAKNSGNDVIYEFVEDCKVGSIAFVEGNYNDTVGMFGRIEFDAIDPTEMFWSEKRKKRDFSDTHLIRARLRSPAYIKENYEGITDEDLTFEGVSDEEGKKTQAGLTSGDNYAEGVAETEGGSNSDAEDEDVWEIEAWLQKTSDRAVVVYRLPGSNDPRVKKYAVDGKDKEAIRRSAQEELGADAQIDEIEIKKVKVRVQRIVVGKKQIGKDKENPSGEDSDGLPIMKWVPMVHDRKWDGYGTCPTDKALPVNREKNKRRAQFILSASQNINAPIIEYEGTTKWTGTPGTPGSRVMVSKNAPAPPSRLSPGSMDIARFYDLEAVADKDIDDQYDMHDVMRGKMPAGDPSGRMVLALQDMGGMMSKPFLRKVEQAIVAIGKVNISLALKHWPRYMWERLIEPDEVKAWTPEGNLRPEDFKGKEEELIQATDEIETRWKDALERIRPSDPDAQPGYSLLDIDVRVTAGSSMPTNRIAKSMMAAEFVKAGIYDAEAALEYVDDPNKDKVAQRMKERERAMMEAGMMKGMK